MSPTWALVLAALISTTGAAQHRARLLAAAVPAPAPSLTAMTEAQVAQRALLLEEARPSAVGPAVLLTGSVVLATAGTASTALAVLWLTLGIPKPYVNAGYLAAGAIATLASFGLIAGALGMLQGAFEKLRQRVLADRALEEVHTARRTAPAF